MPANTTMLSSGGMTKRLDRLVQAGLVERRPDPADRRGTLVRLSRRGKTTIDKAVEAHVANARDVLLHMVTTGIADGELGEADARIVVETLIAGIRKVGSRDRTW